MRSAGPYPTAQQGDALRRSVERLHDGKNPETLVLVPTSDDDPYGILVAKWADRPGFTAWDMRGDDIGVFPMSLGYFGLGSDS